MLPEAPRGPPGASPPGLHVTQKNIKVLAHKISRYCGIGTMCRRRENMVGVNMVLA